jgi:hypothetical protein
MGKPDDIPQDVWDKVAELVWSPKDDDFTAIARAILAAKAEEREACAQLADERANICADAVTKINAGELYKDVPLAAATESCAGLEASHIARLIRKREEA